MNAMEIWRPHEGASVRFCTSQSIEQDLRGHGIDGVYRDGRFWSADGADHWSPHEVTLWVRRAPAEGTDKKESQQ